ncbi:ABC transporter permease subunit [Dongia sedimenti]|uniref:ABC transporter permease subunit n=1 Tax=Dongia sedimenti TaxID=3064282 RepID=A0ABU0YKP1_9PROT|nr:ABC transporter permease subunit [Rhodospirillaceae bacterium R-7]
MSKRLSWFIILVLILGYFFLYGPIVSLIFFSFNASKLVTVWGGFSTKWYGELIGDDQVITAFLLSLRIALISSTIATILGTIAGYVLARFGLFRGRTVLSGMVTAPLVMPEVITGLSMLLLFVQMQQLFGWPTRGSLTITIAHITFTMSYIAVVMQSRFSTLDISLVEAAQDLGARPLKVFFVITLPIVAPAIVSGFLLGFTISIDDLVITSFTSGPGANTLPMVIFSKVRLGLNPEINALASLIIAVVATGVVASTIYMAQAEKRRQRDMQMAVQANE